ncbi:hypothetical protein [Paracraurococcus ruber]|uniref:Uncharacterized protein n=1 Tax=Paracraurococcus ruber TaxID=77675 RepID=A0ABS1D3D9_9PROT|nr:hypothetical protein [Paracraurococcus ruber]MBK1661183.1 hypothetical protein [Paracraurococcus ruber]TDG29316.1 hypothetical protein E2C05_18125 [Paracraurococcus ruber]
MQRIACALIGGALMLITALVGLLLSDALAPGRIPPMLAFWGACGAGALLILGLVLLERNATPAALRIAGPETHGRPRTQAAGA